jgi:hypothetical protein
MSDLSRDGMVEQELHGINLSLSVLVMNAKDQWKAGRQIGKGGSAKVRSCKSSGNGLHIRLQSRFF